MLLECCAFVILVVMNTLKFYACQMSALQEDCRCFFIRMNTVDNDCILTFVHTAVEHDYNLNLARSL